jgi:aryl-alcohol dehydrogenase-like predicted oxidoreductase
MKYATLGKTGLRVSRLGIGLAQLGALSPADTEKAGKILGSALDAGINFFDTAECYGNSEELIGKTVAHRRDEIVLATKAGHVSTGSSGKPWTGQTMRESIDRSLVKLNTDHVDVVQVHAYDISAPLADDIIQAVLDAKDAGKTRFVGYSGENEDAEWAVQSGLFDTLQTSFNLVDQRARYGLFEQARSRGVGIIAKHPIANAVWGYALASDGDARVSGTDLQRLRRARAMLELGPIEDCPSDPVVLALGFALAHEDVHTGIVGTGSPAHMLANIDTVERGPAVPEGVVTELRRRFDQLGKDWRAID